MCIQHTKHNKANTKYEPSEVAEILVQKKNKRNKNENVGIHTYICCLFWNRRRMGTLAGRRKKIVNIVSASLLEPGSGSRVSGSGADNCHSSQLRFRDPARAVPTNQPPNQTNKPDSESQACIS